MSLGTKHLWSHKCPKKWDQYTLIALVITIIVLLILAGVTIATLTGDNGLLQKAGEARNINIEAEVYEKIKIASISAALSENGNINNKEGLINQLKKSGIIIQENQIEEQEDMWVYNRNSDIIYYIYRDGTVLKDDLSNGNIPILYTKLKYLCDSGTQYIKTGYEHDSNAIFEIKTTYNTLTEGPVSTVRYYFGSNTSDGKFIRLTNTSAAPRVISYEIGNKNWYNNNWSDLASNANRITTVRCGNKIGLYIDDSKRINAVNYPSFDAAEIYLFALNDNNNDVLYGNINKTIIMNFKIYDENENLMLNFVPCLDKNNRPCMYETVSHKSFYNQGSGEFGYEMENGTYVAPK